MYCWSYNNLIKLLGDWGEKIDRGIETRDGSLETYKLPTSSTEQASTLVGWQGTVQEACDVWRCQVGSASQWHYRFCGW